MHSFDDLIYEKKNALESKVCEDIIQRFRHDDRKFQGVTTSGQVEIEIKKSMDLPISNYDEWEDIDRILFASLAENLEEYSKTIIRIIDQPLWPERLKDNGYNVKRYREGDYYHWHVDAQVERDGWTRTIACIWYLNEVEEGGDTEFAYGRSIHPETGKLLLFPATWNFPHRGTPPKRGNKYIVTSFVSAYQEVLMMNANAK